MIPSLSVLKKYSFQLDLTEGTYLFSSQICFDKHQKYIHRCAMSMLNKFLLLNLLNIRIRPLYVYVYVILRYTSFGIQL